MTHHPWLPIRPRRAALTVLAPALTAALVLAGCGDSASPSAKPSRAEPSSVAATPSPEPAGSAGASVAAAVPELEELIPDEIGGIPMEKQSQRGEDFVGSQQADELTLRFLEAVGVEPSDVSVAVGFGLNQQDGSGVGLLVFRAEGADQEALVREFKAASDTDREDPLAWETVTVGGKEVERAEDPLQGGQVVHLYSRGDTLFLVTATSAELAAETLQTLP
ncbi:MAG TPA: hypothetical protein VFH63_05760 [candidate division Zixibacteria bacterium]|nr:hypothetical protein [candidate division Zixibacteria bacterium]